MESQPLNPEFRINPENFHPCVLLVCCSSLPSLQFNMHTPLSEKVYFRPLDKGSR